MINTNDKYYADYNVDMIQASGNEAQNFTNQQTPAQKISTLFLALTPVDRAPILLES